MTVDLYIHDQKDSIREVLDYVHHLILHLAPTIDASIKWRIPYYTQHKGVLYLNPLKSNKGLVEVCFTRGRRFEYGRHLLDYGTRKIVGGYTLQSLQDIDENELTLLVREALRLDQILQDDSPWKPTIDGRHKK